MEREVRFYSAYDRRNTDPSKNYGIHGVDIRFHLKGELGVTQFVIFTNWHLPHVQEDLNMKATAKDHYYIKAILNPLPADVGYHSPKPMYEGHESIGECELLDGKPCYYDGSVLAAERVFEVLLNEGDEGVWRELEEYYVDKFGELK